jgi:putative spermidine/putrescine transport system substrate-binding protein
MEDQRLVRSVGPEKRLSIAVTRRRFLGTAVASGVAVAGGWPLPFIITPARGAEKQIKIGMWAGPRSELIKATLIKQLEEKHRVKFLVDEGWTTEQLSRLRASKNNPAHTVMFLDDVGVNIAKKEGLIEKLPEDKMPNMANVFPRYIIEDGYGVGIDVGTVALSYNTREMKESPTSWAALWDPPYKGRVTIPSIIGTHGLNMVVIAAALATGKPFQEAQYESDAAFKQLLELKPNLHSIWTKNALVMAAMQQGELLLMGPSYSSTIWPYIDEGLQAGHVIPQEGGFAGLGCQTLVKGGPHPELGAEFINGILALDMQASLAKKLSVAPVVKDVELPPQVLARIAYGEGKEDMLFASDWEFINSVRPEWTERWNKSFT